jgi:hypothetical protein
VSDRDGWLATKCALESRMELGSAMLVEIDPNRSNMQQVLSRSFRTDYFVSSRLAGGVEGIWRLGGAFDGDGGSIKRIVGPAVW